MDAAMNQESPATEAAYEDTLREIEDAVQEVTRLSRTAVSSERFLAELLQSAVRTLAAIGGAVWMRRVEGLRLEFQVNLAHTGLVSAPDADVGPDLEERSQQHLRLLDRVASETTNRAVSPRSGSGHTSQGNSGLPENPTDCLLLLCPVAVDDHVLGVIEIFQRADVSPAACQGFLRFLGALAELTADFLRNSQLRELKDRAALWGQFESFTDRVHQGLNVEQIASAIANDGRQLIGCDRLSVAVPKGSRCRIVAVSGIDSVDRRSNVVRAGEDLIRCVIRTREPFWYQDTQEASATGGSAMPDLPPQLAEPVNRYLDDSPARLLAVFPLIPGSEETSPSSDKRENRQPVGALIIERFEGTSDTGLLRHRSEVVARQGALALSNAQEFSNLPFLSILQLIGALGWHLRLRQLPRTTVVLGTIAVAILALVLVPGDFTIDGRAELQPAIRRGVFAATDGTVASLSKKLSGGQAIVVSAGEELIQLSNSDLEFELTRVTGDLRTARQSLSTTKIERNNVDQNDSDWRSRLEQLAAREKELETRITGLDAELDVLDRQREDLKRTSPIDGLVLTWEPTRILESRPVRRGDLLLRVADVDGPWVLEVFVKGQNIGYVKDARRELQPELDVSFVLATDPKQTFHGKVTKVAQDARSHGEEGPTVLVTVEIDRETIPDHQLHPGATVIPHIHCGERPIGFVWFHELIFTLRTKVFF
jgi:hypothetical protein